MLHHSVRAVLQPAPLSLRPLYRQPVPLRMTWTARLVQLVLVGGSLALASAPRDAAAQTAPSAQAAESVRRYDISPGPLGAVLARFVSESGVLVAGAGELAQGKSSPGVSGELEARAALNALLAGTGLTAAPGDAGSYVLQRVPIGAEGGVTTLAPVAVQGDSFNATEGSHSYAMTGPLSVATGLPLTLRETPQTVSVMTRQRIEDEGIDSIETLLDRTPGISVQNIGASRFSVLSRGYGIDNYQFDGVVTATDIVSQNIPQSQADLAIYDRVEILRGATGLLTGAGDPSGTINLVRKKPTREFQGYLSLSGGTWGRGRGEVDVGGPINDAGTVRGRFVAAHEQGDTYIDYYKEKKTVLYGVLEADLTPNTMLTAGLDYQKSDPRGQSSTGLPLFYSDGKQTDFDASDNAAARWNTNEIQVYNAFLNLEHRFVNDWKLKFSGNYMYGEREFSAANASWGFVDRASGGGARLYGGLGSARQRQSGYDLQTSGPFELWGRKHEVVLGMNWSEFKNFHEPMSGAGIEGRAVNIYNWDNETAGPNLSGQKLMDYDGWQKQQGVYSALRLKPTDDLAVIMGARVSNYRYKLSQIYVSPALARNNKITEMSESGVVTPYAGVVYDLNEQHSVYASYTSIFRPQGSRDRNGNVLDPRTGDNYEIGLKSEFFGGRLNSAVALYQIRQDNLAEPDPGQTVPGTVNEPAYRAVSGAKTSGLDIEFNGELTPGWQAAVSYSYSATKDADGQAIRTVFPRHMAKLWTTYRLPGDWHRLTVGGGLNWQSRIYYTATTSSLPGITLNGEQPAYVVTNLMARYDFNRQLSATLNVNNVFDKKYLQGLDTTFYSGTYAPTRNAMLTLKYQF
ncbi:TonB-dependent siderophore receptor [Achromobacter piechaudii]|uniref:Ferric-pseudobactin 358 receptor n=1 Tax=Achromobacter piechaudii TaxID=72556 RepID=A0ABM8KUI2_9BURK|nr:TonB-dependent siderophore receptor [Achromobacter piechaudii]CAB3679945.1 Ferric-pseudobactin 358 receptor [Achromobacter piechaudii]CAB3844892.1 Ferric-pseudobactin 358 receptor [Achromobacter piechaudii]CAB3941100.1 Ferric-pseudobactin 358 receptor [Achromobacter piechaudii]